MAVSSYQQPPESSADTVATKSKPTRASQRQTLRRQYSTDASHFLTSFYNNFSHREISAKAMRNNPDERLGGLDSRV
ncbi:hypothetical protein BDV40DRAFT_272191 [Aspergillus tamarii]|uniref:Uncharacterized protein n=1 Tax=Aspergillus tamarii TaxID=41984 RepID=A0A5N6UMM2_ASPTM|nr:hypothetical protein BDV40DRAFT_272191 [Aspergillus tamarii]